MHPELIDIAGRIKAVGRPLVMGILNVTPDSFADGGRWLNKDEALKHALGMVAAGADLIDVGGESTRPGAEAVSAQEEMDRVITLIGRIRGETNVHVSIDTSKPQVMREAVNAGADMINDVCALQNDGAMEAAVALRVPVCLMHMLGQPRDMQKAPVYSDVVAQVSSFLLSRARSAQAAGIPASAILLDPGFGFGKTLQHNIDLFRAIPQLRELGFPLLLGLSRKSMLGAITGRPLQERLAASVSAALLAAQYGASILRVHDVAETVDALKMAAALAPPTGQ